ncbi:lipoprotein-releasing system permease protein [Dysgonomonas sp. PH5-45]|uniref:ABC transporter permease n=1 Tax=unclassified Dysgonomonas TaxID=2630389 RepID=UPI0024735C29|nr:MULTISPECIES: ABC transporter permease [unclassified Dysgonomonas]MDH6355638.1 lipoprotein-releasing system permease protein [Dysgonomonas sp. PH5-45]MDH6388535.1 lipoprotein-releasing system permease protein [Dysgonomonas sp. PH5-37]
MNLELFIARKIYFGGNYKNKASRPAIKIAIAGIALGLAAMILSVCIIVGFKKQVREKVVGFGSHIQITNFDTNSSYESHPICVSDSLLKELKAKENIRHVEVFSTKPGIIKTNTDFMGVVLKGIGADFDWTFFEQNMVEGNVLDPTKSDGVNQVIISKYIADKLNLKMGDSFITYFIQEQPKPRKFTITGIYNTNFENYDKIFMVTDIEVIRKLNGWEKDQASGIEVLVDDYDRLDDTARNMFFDMATYRDREGNSFKAMSIKDINPIIFEWLNLLDMNVWIMMILMLAVSGFTMISGLLILILERTNMIGILKALGAKNFVIRKTFLYVSSFLILKGLLWGNVVALAICFVQKYFGIIKLDPSTYYVSVVPIDMNIVYILLINIGTLLVSMLMMVGPSYLIARISPAKSIKFE